MLNQETTKTRIHQLLPFFFLLSILGGIGLTANYSFLLFHQLAEGVSLIVAGAIFIVTWHTRKITSGSFLTVIGFAFAFVGLVDYLHALSYPGMRVFSQEPPDLSIDLWHAARHMQSLALFLAPFFIGKRINPAFAAMGTGTAAAMGLLAAFSGHIPPSVGTPTEPSSYNVLGEITTIVILSGALIHLCLRRKSISPRVWQTLSVAIILSIASSAFFFSYGTFHDPSDIAGHLLKVASLLLIYRVLLAENLENPYSILFHRLHDQKELLREANAHLEQRVQERTKELADSNLRLTQEMAARADREQRLIEMESKFQLVTSTIDDVLWISHPDLETIVYLSPGFEKIFGCNSSLVQEDSSNYAKYVHPDDVHKIDRTLTSSNGWSCVYRIVRPDGEIRWIREKGFAVRNDGGNITSFAGTLHDITELKHLQIRLEEQQLKLEKLVDKRTEKLLETNKRLKEDIAQRKLIEEELRKSERIFRSVVEQSQEGIVLLDTRGRIVEWNAYQQSITGFSREKVLHKPMWHTLWQLSRPADSDAATRLREDLQEAFQEVLNGRTPPLFATGWETTLRVGARERTVVVSVFCIPHVPEIAAAAIVTDITIEKNAQAQLINLAKFPEEDPHPVVRTSPDGQILFFNNAAERLFSFQASGIIDIPPFLLEGISQAWDESEPVHMDFTLDEETFAFSIVPLRELGYVNIYGIDISERIGFERQLITSERKYRHLVESISEGIWVLDPQGESLYVNAKLKQVLGYDPLEFPDTTISDVLDPSSQAVVREMLGAPLQPSSRQFEGQIVGRNRHRLDVLIDLSITVDPQGHPQGAIASLLDITSRKNEENLRARLTEINTSLIGPRPLEDVLPAILQKSCLALGAGGAAVLLRADSQWHLSRAWGRAKEAFGDLSDSPPLPECLGVYEDGSLAQFGNHSAPQTHHKVILFSGIPVSVVEFSLPISETSTGILLFLYDGDLSFLRTSHFAFGESVASSVSLAWKSAQLWQRLENELSERKQAQSELFDVQEKLKTLVTWQQHELVDTKKSLFQEAGHRAEVEKELGQRHQALEAVYAMATAFGTSLRSQYDLIALSVANILDMPLVSIRDIHDNHSTIVSRVANGKLIQDGSSEQCHGCPTPGNLSSLQRYRGELSRSFPDCRCLRHSGYRSYVGVPIRCATGEIVGNICAMDNQVRDFSDYEIHLIEIFARYIGHEISRSILESQLRQSQEMKLLGHLTSGVAHEVRNPLNGILAITEALHQDLGEREEFIPYLEHMQNQVDRLSRLMEELLALGRPIAEKSMHPLHVPTLLGQTIRNWQQSHRGDPRVHVIIGDSCEDLHLMGDATKIEQVIVNLLENARQHSAHTPIEVKLARDTADMFRLTICDEGPGVPEEKMARILEPFYTTRKSGTGLGLSIVRHVVESHKGHIILRNNSPQPGLSATILLPMLQQVPKEKIMQEITAQAHPSK